jgi:signal transduction histidine kinase/DNA-binding response OmpR family regulator/HAMP domain-containing protein
MERREATTRKGGAPAQLRHLLTALKAVRDGNFSVRIEFDADGIMSEIADAFNDVVAMGKQFADELFRINTVVGLEGNMAELASMGDVSGEWKRGIDSINSLVVNLAQPTAETARVLTAVARGDLSRKMALEINGRPLKGEFLRIGKVANTMVDQLGGFASEVTRVAREVGTEGKLAGQAEVQGVAGVWKDLTDSVNAMAGSLTSQVRDIAKVTTAVANGDLSRKITVEARGEILELKDTINRMVDQLNAFASEVTRVAREVGTDGKLGGQAQVPGVSGVWADLTDSVNRMANNLTDQVRNIALVTTAVANGDLSQKITVTARGEIVELKDTINKMVDQLNAFGSEVTRVAREVGTEGKLGGQAQVKGVSGVWKDLTDNVNQLAGNLTIQVRAIADVATAVSRGDLSRSITVEAFGEVAELKDNVNRMIINLRDTTHRNEEQDWLKTNLARFTRMLQGQRDSQTVAQLVMSELTPLVNGLQSVFYITDNSGADGGEELKLLSSYAYTERKNVSNRWRPGEGLVGQCALEKKPILVANVPDDYIKITSGLGETKPVNIIVLPVVFEGQVLAVVEIASLESFSQTHMAFLEQLMESLGVVLNTIQAGMRTEELLKQSQDLAQELQTRQSDLKRSNEELEEQAQALKQSQEQLRAQREELSKANDELEDKAKKLEEQKKVVELKNDELELTQASLREKAEQLAVTSKYKSEFLANMSHELRTPLNSLLLLSGLLTENKEQNLTGRQVEYVQTIHSSGNDLLSLINEILDLAKIEAGRTDINVTAFSPAEIGVFAGRAFRQTAEHKGLSFRIQAAEDLPSMIRTDRQRLEQIVRNLLSNAFKFTESGSVTLEIARPEPDVKFDCDTLRLTDRIVAFTVRDTGIGIPKERQKFIWEAFQQVDSTTSRKFGGTGLGLSISREIAALLGGEIHLESDLGKGSIFTLYLPTLYVPVSQPQPVSPPTAGAPLFVEEDQEKPSLEPPKVEQPSAGEDECPTCDADVSTLNEVMDDRYEIQTADRVVLIVENDENLAYFLCDIARSRGFKALVSLRGDSGLALALELEPSAIFLDLALPVMDGWAIFERLKSHPELRHIPVLIISDLKERKNGLYNGAFAYLAKPVDKQSLYDAFFMIENFLDKDTKHVLVVENDDKEREEIVALIGNGDVEVTAVENGRLATEAVLNREFDCMVLDLALPDMNSADLLEKMVGERGVRDLPVIVYNPGPRKEAELEKLKKFSDSLIIKDVDSHTRLLDETSLFLHRVEKGLPADKQRMIRELHEPISVLAGKKILIIDDDVRSIFALTSVLESHEIKVIFAENGKDGVATLSSTPDVDLVLMDIMMPGMDGYETMRLIRRDERHRLLPIVCLTAKAMKGDREKCIKAGASDYVSKPVDVDRLISLLRVWLFTANKANEPS